ncbi:MAG TPA: cupin domain-containing protein [Pirellulales bacterium]
MPFLNIADFSPIEPVPGCRMRTPFGQHLMLSYLEMDAGAEVPTHAHPHEQGGMLLRGRLQLTIGDETRLVEAGAMFLIPPNVPHRAVAVDGPAVVLDVFSPVREDYAELTNRYIPPLDAT